MEKTLTQNIRLNFENERDAPPAQIQDTAKRRRREKKGISRKEGEGEVRKKALQMWDDRRAQTQAIP